MNTESQRQHGAEAPIGRGADMAQATAGRTKWRESPRGKRRKKKHVHDKSREMRMSRSANSPKVRISKNNLDAERKKNG